MDGTALAKNFAFPSVFVANWMEVVSFTNVAAVGTTDRQTRLNTSAMWTPEVRNAEYTTSKANSV
jgi:hypothetical protein